MPGQLPYGLWSYSPLTASLTDANIPLMGSTLSKIIYVPRAGHAHGMLASLSSSVTQGTIIVELLINGLTLTGASVTLDIDHPDRRGKESASNEAAFNALDTVGFRVTTSADFLPTTASLLVQAEFCW
jgi:hypothetical protein